MTQLGNRESVTTSECHCNEIVMTAQLSSAQLSSARLIPSIPVGDFQLGRRLHEGKEGPGPGEGRVLSLLQLLHLLRDLALLVRCKKIERGGEN